MSGNDEQSRVPLSRQRVTAMMSQWMVVDVMDEQCLFGFAERHPNTGGLSWVLSTPITEFTASSDRARTASGRVYQLGREISVCDLDEEGRVCLRLFLAEDRDAYPGAEIDRAWVVARKMARHLELTAPSRNDPAAVERFFELYRESYLARLINLRNKGD